MAREKEEIREKILKASLDLVIEEGCLALSMRKIADRIEYATSTIYEYFENKDAILLALTTNGYRALSNDLAEIQKKSMKPIDELIAMWQGYWNFSFKNEELYKLMFGIQVSCPKLEGEVATIKEPETLFIATILKIQNDNSAEKAIQNYITMWSLVHGLISINVVVESFEKEVNAELITSGINKLIG